MISTSRAIGLKSLGQRLRKIEYSVQLTVAAKIHKSPATNLTCASADHCPLITTCTKPANANAIPSHCTNPKRSRSQKVDTSAINTGASA